MGAWFDSLRALGLTDIVDLAVVAVLLWVGIAWLRTARARLALIGLVILGAVYLLARQIGMPLTAWILQGFVAASVVVVVVVFQEDIRRLFEQIALLGMRRRPLVSVADAVELLARALTQLAEQKRGALVVIPGQEPVDRHLEGGVRLDARISEALLLSLFDPHSPGHDGAVLLAGDRAVLFAAHLPLSANHSLLGQRGTRHAAALGLAERTDALCLVVSEERGTVSVALDGKLRPLLHPRLVAGEIRRFLARQAPRGRSQQPSWRRVVRRWREAAVAVAAACALWLLQVPGGGVVEIEHKAPVRILDLPAGFELERVEPAEVQVTLSGRRRDLLFLEADEVAVEIDAMLVELGRRTFQVDPRDVSHPPRTEVLSVTPDSIKISLQATEAPEG